MARAKPIVPALVAAVWATPCLAFAEEALPFPALRFEAYCKTLVSKMLDKNEQAREFIGCLANEFRLKATLEPYWSLMPPRQQKQVMSHFQAPEHETYTTVFGYESHWIADACLRKVLTCSFP